HYVEIRLLVQPDRVLAHLQWIFFGFGEFLLLIDNVRAGRTPVAAAVRHEENEPVVRPEFSQGGKPTRCFLASVVVEHRWKRTLARRVVDPPLQGRLATPVRHKLLLHLCAQRRRQKREGERKRGK